MMKITQKPNWPYPEEKPKTPTFSDLEKSSIPPNNSSELSDIPKGYSSDSSDSSFSSISQSSITSISEISVIPNPQKTSTKSNKNPIKSEPGKIPEISRGRGFGGSMDSPKVQSFEVTIHPHSHFYQEFRSVVQNGQIIAKIHGPLGWTKPKIIHLKDETLELGI